MSQQEKKKKEHVAKVIVVGDLGTGKTSIIQRYVNGLFSRKYKTTIGVDFASKILEYDEKTTVNIQLWDIGGQEMYRNMTRVYYKSTVGGIVVYDLTKEPTFDAVLKWKEDIDSKVRTNKGEPIPVVLVANKIDLIDEEQEKELGEENWRKNKKEMDEFCKKHNFISWFNTSAKENLNVDECTYSLIDHIITNDIHGDKQVDKEILKMEDEEGSESDDEEQRPKKSNCC
ncbi:ras-related protein rab-32 [Anaeramoeba flamelloides]|uniref:Ras-related protein Rab n=1 Tax=Anaeramoeba flamelloides TaxID=1746091 RepID=A0AAV7YBQ8_9EUKA|nr:ras-related protein rab-32 [Anaeramoeba flamelloides]